MIGCAMVRGRNFKHFKTSVEHSKNWIFRHCITSSHTDVRWYLKDWGNLTNDQFDQCSYRSTYRSTACSVNGVLHQITEIHNKKLVVLSEQNHQESEASSSKVVKKEERGLSELVRLCMKRPLDKSEQLSDWERRPLRQQQIYYAGKQNQWPVSQRTR